MIQATAGLQADGRHISNRARDEAGNYRDTYRSPPPLKVYLFGVIISKTNNILYHDRLSQVG
jgi:20S proteasome alpha/beta subunit